MYYDDDNGSSSGTDWNEGQEQDIATYLADVDPDMHGDVLHHEYMMARQRWRQFSGKHSRFHRRHGRKGSKYGGKYRGRGILGKGYHYEDAGASASAAESPFIGAAYKAGKGKMSPSSGNPKDRMGNVMKCHICNSDQHLARECPQRGKGKGSAPRTFHTQGQSSFPAGSLSGAGYMHTAEDGVPGPEHHADDDGRRSCIELRRREQLALEDELQDYWSHEEEEMEDFDEEAFEEFYRNRGKKGKGKSNKGRAGGRVSRGGGSAAQTMQLSTLLNAKIADKRKHEAPTDPATIAKKIAQIAMPKALTPPPPLPPRGLLSAACYISSSDLGGGGAFEGGEPCFSDVAIPAQRSLKW